MSLEEKQRSICEKFSAPYQPCDLALKVGISKNVKEGVRPINGLRGKAKGIVEDAGIGFAFSISEQG